MRIFIMLKGLDPHIWIDGFESGFGVLVDSDTESLKFHTHFMKYIGFG
jgi:hypothetical protein